jgi:hypothetical protein
MPNDLDSVRYAALMNGKAELTQEEINEGWHFCWERDGLLIHPTWDEYECCNCLRDD